METSSSVTGVRWVMGLSAALACAPAAGTAPRQPASPGGERPLALGADVRAALPAGVDTATQQPPSDDSMSCLTPLESTSGQNSEWHRDVAQRVDTALAGSACRSTFASGVEEEIALRLVYSSDGAAISQHVLSSAPEACDVAECLRRELSGIRSASFDGGNSIYDFGVTLVGQAVPRRSDQPVDPLGSDGPPSSCVDARVARLSRGVVHDAVSATHSRLKGCYDRALGRNHSAAGNVAFEILIAEEGEVEGAFAREATLYDCQAIECMLAQFRDLRFPPPVGGALRVLYPVTYATEQPPVNLR